MSKRKQNKTPKNKRKQKKHPKESQIFHFETQAHKYLDNVLLAIVMPVHVAPKYLNMA